MANEHVDVTAILEIAKPLIAKGYVLMLTVREDEVELTHLCGGDSSCPHRKFFDPADGHGFTDVYADDYYDYDDDDRNLPAKVAARMCEAATALEGTPRGNRRND